MLSERLPFTFLAFMHKQVIHCYFPVNSPKKIAQVCPTVPMKVKCAKHIEIHRDTYTQYIENRYLEILRVHRDTYTPTP